MRFRSIVLTAAALLLVVGSALAQDAKAKDDSVAKPQMSAQELKQRLDKGEKVIIVDARHNLNGEKINNAVHVPSDKLADWAKDIDKKAVIVTYCTCPHDEAAEEEVRELKKMGFENVYSLTGGMSAARKAGIEIKTVSNVE